MNLHDIENLSFAELKDKRDELVVIAKAASVDELAARYVQARQDAKHRDEKLAEQATTIAALNAGTSAMTEKANGLEQQLKAANDSAEAQKQAAAEAFESQARSRDAREQELLDSVAKLERMNESIETILTTKISEQDAAFIAKAKELLSALTLKTDLSERLKTEATRNNAALTGAAKLLNDAIAAQRLEDAVNAN